MPDPQAKDRRLRRLYGISLEEYCRLWQFQNGRCPICGAALQEYEGSAGVRVEVDHDHAPRLKPREAVRGLLCGGRWKGCNRKLGSIDDPTWLRRAASYLDDPPAQAFIRSQA